MRSAPARRAATLRVRLGAALLTLVPILFPAGGSAAQTPAALQILLLPSVRTAGQDEVSAWTSPGGQARFDRMEASLIAGFGEAGYGVIAPSKAPDMAGARAILSEAALPLTAATAAEAARAAGAEVALVIRAEVIRGRAGGGSPFYTTDALVRVTAYRAKDALRLKSASTRVTGAGRGEAEADAEALAHAARPFLAALAGPLAAAVARPIVPARALSITLEGPLNGREYRRVLDVIRTEIPEIENLEERRFTQGRFALLGRCRCEAGEAAERIDGLLRGGFRISAWVVEGGLRVRVKPAAVVPAGPFDDENADLPPDVIP